MAGTTNPVTWFEIPVADMERAARFYAAVFGVNLAVSDMGTFQMAWFPMGESLRLRGYPYR